MTSEPSPLDRLSELLDAYEREIPDDGRDKDTTWRWEEYGVRFKAGRSIATLAPSVLRAAIDLARAAREHQYMFSVDEDEDEALYTARERFERAISEGLDR